MDFNTFKDKWLGQRVDYDHQYAFQCVDLVRQYFYECYGLANEAGGVPYAISYWDSTPPAIMEKFDRIATNETRTGDVVMLYGVGGNIAGHIGIATGGLDGTNFEMLEQNGSTGNGSGVGGDAIRTRWIARSRIAGLLRPKPSAPPYTISAMEPKRMVVAPNHYKWNLAQPNFDAIVANPITESGNGVEFTAVAVLSRPDLPNYKWYLEDANTPHGWNTLDCREYVAPAPLPAPPAPYVPPAAPITAPLAQKYKVLSTVMYFGSAQEAQFKKNALGTLSAKEYYKFSIGDSTVQLGDDNMTAKYWINTKDNVEPVPVKVGPPAGDAWKATAQWFYPGNRNKYDLYELQNDVAVVDLDNKGQHFTIYANKAQSPDDPEQSDNRLLKVYGTVYKDSVKYYVLHDDKDTSWIYWYVIPVINPSTGKSFLLKYSEVYDTSPKPHDLSPGEEAMAALIKLGYHVMDVLAPKRIIAVIQNIRRKN